MKVTYKIISQNPVKLEVDGRETSASITCTVRTTESGDCVVNYLDTKYSYTIPLTPLECDETKDPLVGTIEVISGVVLSYSIAQKPYECEPDKKCDCSCDIIRTWTSPYFIGDDYPDSGDVMIYCEYWHTSASTTEVCSREKRIKLFNNPSTNKPYKKSELPTNPIKITAETGCDESGGTCIKNVYTAKTIDDCTSESSTTLVVNFSTDPEVVPGVGGEVTITCNFKLIKIDDKCHETVDNGSFTSATTIPECSNEEIECCSSHVVNINMPVNSILDKLKLPHDVDVVYNGNVMTESVPIEVIQNRRYDGQCAGVCDYVTTYCVDDSTVKIWYESQYEKGDWECFVEGCSEEKKHEVSSLPIYGGRVRVTWSYTAHTESVTPSELCPSDDIISTWEDILLIGDCREENHPTEYQIYFKEQTPGCTTCSGETMEEGPLAGKVSNTFVITPKQDCNSECNCFAIRKFSIQGETLCDCNNFHFDEEPPGGCNCNNFNFVDEPPVDCDCNNFNFGDEPQPPGGCDCNNFNFEDQPPGGCNCNGFDFDNNGQ